ncbi:PREDICTED: dynamin-related protein 4C-like [Prunus mume]|uniref:Dynamin-related protein 4C-like n=1 Tax=Prunus mume TaxID=102107 RepID=A0ABM0PUL9_PRUMU|nr:PREDICTED: dynamin-related protein 4C-like [Prunus mume]
MTSSSHLLSIISQKMGGKRTQTDSGSRSSSSSILQDDQEGLSFSSSKAQLLFNNAPIVSSYNDKIRPMLDAIDKLRVLMVMEEGIQLPTIVVVGDQSSGKSSVLESLAGISLPRGQGICTRVPLVMRLQHHSDPKPELSLEYNGRVEQTDEENISEDIVNATNLIAGDKKGISDTPLTLLVKKNGVPDLTMVDLPGITRVPVHGQPENIYDQIKDMIMKYIKPDESIILNVLSASTDFSTCESISMSRSVDKTGERTLAVVTKVDMAPEGLLEKVTADDVDIGLGYVCVRNRIRDETYEEARAIADRLFKTHPLLSKIDKSMVGIQVLADKLVQIQAVSIARNLPVIVKKIDDKLNSYLSELNKLPKTLSTVAEAMTVFMQIIGASKESLKKILLMGEFDEFPDDQMHCTARLVEMLNQCSYQLHECNASDSKSNFLVEEIAILEKAKGINLPNFVQRNAFLKILRGKVEGISVIPLGFVEQVWNYIENVVLSVLMRNTEKYYQLQLSARRACQNLIQRMKERSIHWMTEILEMEKLTDYTCNPEYVSEWHRLMTEQETFITKVIRNSHDLGLGPDTDIKINVEGIGMVEVGGLMKYPHVLLSQAFDLKMRMTAYWNVVLRRLIDSMALYLQLSVSNLVNKDMRTEIVSELMGPNNGVGIERMMEEPPSIAVKRNKLIKSIKKLKESKEVVCKIMDGIVTFAN